MHEKEEEKNKIPFASIQQMVHIKSVFIEAHNRKSTLSSWRLVFHLFRRNFVGREIFIFGSS